MCWIGSARRRPRGSAWAVWRASTASVPWFQLRFQARERGWQMEEEMESVQLELLKDGSFNCA